MCERVCVCVSGEFWVTITAGGTLPRQWILIGRHIAAAEFILAEIFYYSIHSIHGNRAVNKNKCGVCARFWVQVLNNSVPFMFMCINFPYIHELCVSDMLDMCLCLMYMLPFLIVNVCTTFPD